MESIESLPLVSVVIITYKQEKIITETLDSIAAQTYPRVELIISDDCSPDGTADVCREWLGRNGGKFERAELVTTAKNTGTCGNLNRGLNASHGEWVKFLAGDDLLMPDAIEEYVRFCTEKKCEFCYAKMKHFGGLAAETQDLYEKEKERFMKKTDLKAQRRDIQIFLFPPGPGCFYSMNLLTRIGGFDEKYMFADEWPQFYKIIYKQGVKCEYLDKYLVKYRSEMGSLCHHNKSFLNNRVYEDQKNFYKDVLLWNDINHFRFHVAIHNLVSFKRQDAMYHKSPDSLAYKLIPYYRFLSPFTYKVFAIKMLKNMKNKLIELIPSFRGGLIISKLRLLESDSVAELANGRIVRLPAFFVSPDKSVTLWAA